MEFWFKRQLEKIELNLQEIQLDIHSKESLSNIYHKLKKYKTSMPWKANNMASSVVFSIASTPFSNYSAISSNSLMKTPQNSSLNNAFYIISSQKQQDSIKNTPIEKDLFKDVMTVTQKEALFLKLVNGKPSQDDFFNDFSHKSVKLEDILNVAKNGDDSSMDCDFLKDIPKNNNNNNKRLPQNSLEKLLKTLNFTGKLSENNPIPLETNKREISFENSHKIIKDLNREIYQHLGETLALSDSLIDSINNDENHINDINIGTYRKDLKGKKVPRLNLEKLHKREGSIHSFSPSYRKNAERSQYLKELFEGEKDKILVKRIKQTNKSMDLSRKPMNFSFIQSRINEKTNKFICNLLQKPNKHSKNNLSLIENCQKDESFIKKSNIKIVNLLKHEEKNENFGQFQKNEDFDKNAKFEKKLPLKEKTNFLNIVAPTSNINVFISGGDFEEKESFNLNPSTRPYKNNRLMKLLSQVNQNKRAKENMNEGFSLGNIMGVLKEKGKEYGLKLRRSKHE